MNQSVHDKQLRDYVATYVRSVTRLRYADVPTLQLPPFATLADGGAGTAYALWRLGDRRRASAWASAAISDSGRGAYGTSVSRSFRDASIMFGHVGVGWVKALLTGGKTIGDYVRTVGTPAGRLEFAGGAAGHLVGLSRLFRQKPSRTLEDAMVVVERRLLRAVMRRTWRAEDATGFAHGWPGILYALLDAHAVRDVPVPSRLGDSLRRLARNWKASLVSGALAGSWCRGAAGATLLWVRAFESTGDSLFLEVAQRAGTSALANRGGSLSLCCGDAGIAYAALALARIDPARDWRRLGKALAVHTVRRTSTTAMHRPCGLFQGHAGLCCLALDYLEKPRGFPLVEG